MLPIPSDNGFASDIFHFGKRGSLEARKRGQDDSSFKLAMAAALIYMGAKIGMEAFERMNGGRIR